MAPWHHALAAARVIPQPFARAQVGLAYRLRHAVPAAPADELEARLQRQTVPHRHIHGIEALAVGRAQRGAPRETRRADERARIAARRAGFGGGSAHAVSGEAVDDEEILRDADRRDFPAHAEVAREAEFLRMEYAVAVDKNEVREEMRLGAPKLSEEVKERPRLPEGEVAGDVRQVELDPRVRLVDDLERRQREDNESGARFSLRVLHERNVDATDQGARGRIDEVGVDTLASPLAHLRRPPPAQQAPAERARAARHVPGRPTLSSALGANNRRGPKRKYS